MSNTRSARAAANGHGVFDLDAAEAAAREGDVEPFRFKYRGETYEVPPGTEWPLSAMTALAAGNLPAAMGELLGVEQYAHLEATGIKLGALNVLFEAIGKAAGVDGLPNSALPQPPASVQT